MRLVLNSDGTSANPLLKGRFDERKYQVSRPRPERKSLHESEYLFQSWSLFVVQFVLLPVPISPFPVQDSAPGSHPNAAIPVDDNDQPQLLKPVVPTGSFTVINNLPIDGEEEEMAIINKPVPAVTLQLWQGLLKPRGFELNGGKLVRSPSKSQATWSPPSTLTRPQARSDMVNRNGTGVEPGKGKEKESVISSFRRAKSFAPVPVKEPAVRQPFRRNTTCPVVCSGEVEGSGSHYPVQPEGQSAIPTLFAGYSFRLLGEARCPNVRFAIENCGGVVTDGDAEEPSFIIVRLIRCVPRVRLAVFLSIQTPILTTLGVCRGSGSKLYHDEFDDYARTKYRTECWLEHSVFHERICEPEENVSFTPLRITTPVPGTSIPIAFFNCSQTDIDAEKINLSLSGLDQSELCWIRRLVRAVGSFSSRSSVIRVSHHHTHTGITLEPIFSRRSTHLFCPSGTGAKFDKALEWRIPVVSLAWLEEIARTGTIPRVDGYLVGGSRVGATVDGEDGLGYDQQLDPVLEVKKDKGKGKEKEVDYQMMDITNGNAVHHSLSCSALRLIFSPFPRRSYQPAHVRQERSPLTRHGPSRLGIQRAAPPRQDVGAKVSRARRTVWQTEISNARLGSSRGGRRPWKPPPDVLSPCCATTK